MGEAERKAAIIKQSFDAHEQQLFLRFKAGKSLHALAQIYRMYDGPNAVRDKLNELELRLGSAAHRAAGIADEDDDNLGGVPLRRVPASNPEFERFQTLTKELVGTPERSGVNGSLNGAGAVPGKSTSTPPTRPAPATSQPAQRAALPPERCDVGRASPASASEPAPTLAPDLERSLLALMAGGRWTTAAGIAEALPVLTTQAARRALEALRARGAVKSLPGAPLRWALIGVPDPPVARMARPMSGFGTDAVLEALMEHGPMIRSEILTRVSISHASVHRAVGQLAKEGRIVETGRRTSAAGGAPATLWAIAPVPGTPCVENSALLRVGDVGDVVALIAGLRRSADALEASIAALG